MHEQKQIYSLRKLSVGLASVVVGTCVFIGHGQQVKADTVNVGEQPTSTVIQQDSSKKQDANSNKQNDQLNVSNSKTEQQQSTNERNDVENVDSNLNDTNKLDNATKTVESEANQKFDQVKDKFKQDTSIDANGPSSVIEENDEGKTIQKADVSAKAEATKKAVAVVLRADSSETTLNLNGTNAIDPETLKEDKTETIVKSDPARGIDPVKFASNGGFDPKIWGTMDTSKWQLDNNGNITGYTGDMNHIIIPNSADFAKVGKSYSQIGISSYEMQKLGGKNNSKANTLAISLTDNKKVKATDDDLRYTFNGSTLKQANLEGLDTSNVTYMYAMFRGASSLTSLDVSNWDTGNVTNMYAMFEGASSLTSLDVSKWNTGTVTDMSYMFKDANSLHNLDVSNWNTGNVVYMNWMFNGASNLTSLDVSNWNTSKVTGMNGMFNGASSLTSLNVSHWDTSKVTSMISMFNGASGLTSLDVSKWDTSNVVYMSLMFGGASRLTSLDVSNWNTSKVTGMTGMFNGASGLTSLDVSKWDTSNVTDMSFMFYGASGLTSLDVSKWDTSNVTDMSYMFNGASGLTSLDVINWDTSRVTGMKYMFSGASSLTSLDVSHWDTGNVTNMYDMFDNNPKLALIVNGDKFADHLLKNNFAGSNIDSGVKSVTTNSTKLLQLLTNDSQHDSAIRTIALTFPANYSPDLAKYHLTKNGNTYQIKQSADYDKSYLQGTVLINATYGIAYHHIDTTKTYKLSDTWQPNYDKLVLAHKNSDGSVSFDAIQLPKVPGYKTIVKTVVNPVNPARALFAVSFMALPKPVTSVPNDTKPAETFSPATPATTEVTEPIKTEPKVATTPKIIDLSNDVVATTPDVSTWQVADEPNQNTYHVSNGKYAVELPHISNAQLHVIANDSTKDSILFTYKRQKAQYVFKIKFVNGHYLLTTYKIKSGKLVKLIDYNFIKSSKMIDVILDWLQLE